MKKSDKIELRRLEVIKKLNDLNKVDELSDEQRAEETALLDENDKMLKDKENALRFEATQPEIEQRSEETPEQREWSALSSQIELRSYVNGILSESRLDGREQEVRAELGLADNQVPWAAIAPREERATAAVSAAPATVGTQQQSIIQRVFADSASAFLGVEMPTVGVGQALYPIITTGTTAEQLAKDEAVTGTAATIRTEVLGPVRLATDYLFRIEDRALLAGLEEALREDMGKALSDAMDVQVLTGDGTAPNVSGFYTELPAATAAEDEAETFVLFLNKTNGAIDQTHPCLLYTSPSPRDS